MAEIIWAAAKPFLGYIIGVVAILGVVSGVYFKIKHDAVVEEKAKIEQEKQDAIKKANEARARVGILCGSGAVPNCPSEWFRD